MKRLSKQVREIKAVATHSIFLIIIATLMIFFLMVVFANFLPTTQDSVDGPICWSKQINYCAMYSETDYTERPEWDPNCGFGRDGPTENECREILNEEQSLAKSKA